MEPAVNPIPQGMNVVTVQLWFNGQGRKAMQFYRRAFAAEQVGYVAATPDGRGIMHAMMKIGDTNLMIADAWPGQWERGPTDTATAGLQIYTEDCDRLFNRARKEGCEIIFPVTDMFWGDRVGKLKDPYGHCWVIATHKQDLTDEELEAAQKEWLATLPAPADQPLT